MPLTIGITGTKGKSTTMFLLKHCLSTLNKNIISSSSTEGMYYNDTWLRHVYLHDYFDTENREHDIFLSEATSFLLKKEQYEYKPQDVAVFTGIELYEHSDQHSDFEDYLQSKKKLFDITRANGFGVVNSDDEHYTTIIKDFKGKVVKYGQENSDFMFVVDEITKDYMSLFILIEKKLKINIKTHLLGIFNAYNITAVLAVLLNMGFDLDLAIKSIESFEGVEGRFQRIEYGNNNIAIIDYAHTDGSLKLVLELIKELYPDKKLVTIFGCGGNKSVQKRPLMGKWATEYSDNVILTNDNPRKEDSAKIVQDILHGIKTKNYEIIYDRASAIERGLFLYPNSIVLIAGKGSEKFLLSGDNKIEISDFGIIDGILNGTNK